MHKITVLVALLFNQFVLAQESPKEEKPKELEDVVVEKQTKTFTNKNGNIKVDVANSIYNSVPNMLDLLEKLPKIRISPDANYYCHW